MSKELPLRPHINVCYCIHDLRVALITALFEDPVPYPEIARWLGHSLSND
jgi:hypothetical protein